MAWCWPDGLFDIGLEGGGELINCRYVAHDDMHVTVDRDWPIGLGRTLRLRTQIKLDAVRSIHQHAPAMAALEMPAAMTEHGV